MGMTEEAAKSLRAEFDPATIGKLPRTTCKACSDSSSKVCEKHKKERCPVCQNYMTTAHLHLDYVGHAAVTDRLLSVDPAWTWEPVAFDADGAPLIQRNGNESKLWIRLTVSGVTRLGVGIASGFELEKQLISDAIRNAAMRFGVALDLWSKEDLHQEEPAPPPEPLASKNDVDLLKACVEDLAPEQREMFTNWKNDQGFAWPWTERVLLVLEAKLEEIASAAGEAPAPTGEPGEPSATPSPAAGEKHGYDLWSKEDLVAECTDRQLPHSGDKMRLVNELRAFDVVNNPGVEEPDLRPF